MQAIGSFEALNDILADDFWLGEFTRLRGLRTVLSDVVVTTDVTDSSLAGLWAHELRWLRTIRAAEPAGLCHDLCLLYVAYAFAGSGAGAHRVLTVGMALLGVAPGFC